MVTIDELVSQRNEAIKYIHEMYKYYNKDFYDKEIKFLFKYELIIGSFDDKKNKFINIKSSHCQNIHMITDYCIRLHKFFEKCDKDGYICPEKFSDSPLNLYFLNLFQYKFGEHFDYVYDYIEEHIMNENIDFEKTKKEVTDFYLDLINKKEINL